jgi:hypothetical protein
MAGMVAHIHVVNLNVLKVYGAGNQYLLQGIVKYALTISGVLIGVQFGLMGLMYGIVVVEYLQMLVNIYLSNLHLSYTYTEQGSDLIRVLLISMPMSIVLYLLNMISWEMEWVQLVVMGAVGLFTYLITAWLGKPVAWMYIIDLIRNQFKKTTTGSPELV